MHDIDAGLMNTLFVAIDSCTRNELIYPGKNAEFFLRKSLRKPCCFQPLTKEEEVWALSDWLTPA